MRFSPQMPRLIEILLFVTPFLGFAAWRLLFPSPLPPLWLIGGLAGVVLLLLVALLWIHHIDNADANLPYRPAELHDGRVIPARPGEPP
jgi:hypothetical protein